MTHPDWVLKFKEKKTEIKLIKGNYYLYKITSKWNPEKKRTQKITLGLIGRITTSGVISTQQRKEAREQKQTPYALEFGASDFLHNLAKDSGIIKHLQNVFQEVWQPILILAIIRLLHMSPLKNCQLHHEDSYLRELYPDVNLDKNVLTKLLASLGSHRTKILEFMKHFVVGAEHIIFDATCIISNSKHLEINHPGYNSKKNFDPQVNLLYVFSADQRAPCYYRILPGNVREMAAFSLSLEEAGLKNAIVIVDKGFCSVKNIATLDRETLNYIVPMKRDNRLIDYEKLKSTDKKNFDNYLIFEERVIWYLSYEKQNKKVIIFFDAKLAELEHRDYMLRLEKGCEGYSLEQFYEKQYKFGIVAVVTNLDVEIGKIAPVVEVQDKKEEQIAKEESAPETNKISPALIYKYLKTRMMIENMFDVFKNVLEADRTYMRSEQSLEAWVFLNHIAMMLYYQIQIKLLERDLSKKLSPVDLLARLKQIRKVKIKDQWKTSEITKKTNDLLKLINKPVT